MAKAKVKHCQASTIIYLEGDPKKPEPPITAIHFPFGNIEVSRANDGDEKVEYWVHFTLHRGNTSLEPKKGRYVDSRMDTPDGVKDFLPLLPEGVTSFAIRIGEDSPDEF